MLIYCRQKMFRLMLRLLLIERCYNVSLKRLFLAKTQSSSSMFRKEERDRGLGHSSSDHHLPTTMSTEPPAYPDIPTLYDETHRGKWPFQPEVATVGNSANMLGYLEHHASTTDGSFAICMAGGSENLVSQALYESIPEVHRPPLNTEHAGVEVSFSIFGSSQKAIGSIIMPIILTDAEGNTQFRIKLFALVMPELLMGMFIGYESAGEYWRSALHGGGKVVYEFEFKPGQITKVEYCRSH
ncbi:unnamed protein product [Cyclocybe aegerita]|uniref:Uncharacterized protein n=1 Tax=Cyclocybe aegerita TaxID=1973307 RepID=A0A8S0X191_CYCAE|nr:unnamed protein product [Cyclocybe aegerita]